MIFYRAVDADGRLHLCPNQAEAKKINKDYDEFDCPIDKPGLMGVLQDLIDRAQTTPQTALQEPQEAPVGETTAEPVIALPGSSPEAPADPKARCPKCTMTLKGAQRIADMRINELFGDELYKLPDESIIRASEVLTSRLLEVARSTGTMLKGE